MILDVLCAAVATLGVYAMVRWYAIPLWREKPEDAVRRNPRPPSR